MTRTFDVYDFGQMGSPGDLWLLSLVILIGSFCIMAAMEKATDLAVMVVLLVYVVAAVSVTVTG